MIVLKAPPLFYGRVYGPEGVMEGFGYRKMWMGSRQVRKVKGLAQDRLTMGASYWEGGTWAYAI